MGTVCCTNRGRNAEDVLIQMHGKRDERHSAKSKPPQAAGQKGKKQEEKEAAISGFAAATSPPLTAREPEPECEVLGMRNTGSPEPEPGPATARTGNGKVDFEELDRALAALTARRAAIEERERQSKLKADAHAAELKKKRSFSQAMQRLQAKNEVDNPLGAASAGA